MIKNLVTVEFIFQIAEKHTKFMHTEYELTYSNPVEGLRVLERKISDLIINDIKSKGNAINDFIVENKLEEEISKGFDFFILKKAELIGNLLDYDRRVGE
jgi:hypothetical protein